MRNSKRPISELVPLFISKGKEGEFWDFKQEWHEKMPDLIKDIICFANTSHDEDCYLFFGVSDAAIVTGMKKARRQLAEVLDALSNLSYAGDNIPEVTLDTMTYEDKEIDVLTIKNTNNTPIYLKKSYGEMLAGCIYARDGDRNTPNKGNAEIALIEKLWKKRLGLLKPPLEYIIDSFDRKLEWIESEESYYNLYRPEYTLERRQEDNPERDQDEFYSYSQTNEKTSFFTLDIKANGTVLKSHQIAILDSGRLLVPVPEWGCIYLDSFHQDVLVYKYYIRDSFSDRLLAFMYNPSNSEERWAFEAFEKVIIFYESDEERSVFEKIVAENSQYVCKLINNSVDYDYIAAESKEKTEQYKKRLRTGIVLNALLSDKRKISL